VADLKRSAKKTMSPHYWIEVRSMKKMAVFVAAVIAVAIFWSVLPTEIKEESLRRSSRGVANLPVVMFIGWIGGWFLLLFVRAEDLHITAPFDFQGMTRITAVAMIGVSLLIGGFFSLSFFV
jgi:hypothetical protein